MLFRNVAILFTLVLKYRGNGANMGPVYNMSPLDIKQSMPRILAAETRNFSQSS